LDRLVLSLIEHDRERRPASAADVSCALEKVVLLDPFRPLTPPGRRPLTVLIPAGSYVIGEKAGNRTCDQPQKKIRLSAFRITAAPITNGEYRRFLGATGYQASTLIDHPLFGADNHPVVMVNWDDAISYANWAGGRLPTELEWEVAAKGEKMGNAYPWGASEPKATLANIDNVCSATTPVGSYRLGCNKLGMMDCCGNVWEWCADVWEEGLLKVITADALDPQSQGSGNLRAIRGGSFDSPAISGRTTFRHRLQKELRHADVGFRVVFGP
jgi:formylglycine-generating enzyme required for sulfatase activity